MKSGNNLEAGPILKQGAPIIYALDSDESSMIVPEDQLSKRQQEEDGKYVRENSSFGLAALCISDKEDALILDKEFEAQKELLGWLSNTYSRMGLEVSKDIFFAPPKHFYKKALEVAKKKKYSKISSTSVSYVLSQYFDVEELLEASIKVNRKTSLFDLSQKYNFDTPQALYVASFTDSLKEIERTFLVSDYPLFVKGDGLGGGSNISKIKSAIELDHLTNIKIDSGGALVQASAPKESLETISTFSVYPDRIEYINTRGKMVDGGQWYGNVFNPELVLAESQKKSLQNAALACQSEGYVSESGLLVGFDAFLHEDKALITEINARWLGSTQYEQLLKRLGLLGKTIAVSSFDYIHDDEISSYKKFVEQHLFEGVVGDRDFSVIPISFSAYVEENDTRLVSYLVLGGFGEFVKAARENLSSRSFVMQETSLGVYDKVLTYVK